MRADHAVELADLITAKVGPALAAGCTVLKAERLSPLSALLFAEVIADAGVPPYSIS